MADVQYFLRLGDIEGSSTDKEHPKEIELLSWAWGASNSGRPQPGGGGGAGKVEVDELTFVAQGGVASPKIFLACAQGRHLPEAVITGRRKLGKGEKQNFLVIRLKEVLIASFATIAGEDDLPEDEVSIVFDTIEIEMSEGGATVKAGWDIGANTPL
jgi:type VI secretion system secreted protein Hcp